MAKPVVKGGKTGRDPEVETVEVEKSKHLTSLKREEEEREPRLSQKGSETKRIIEKRKRIYAWRRKAGVENAL